MDAATASEAEDVVVAQDGSPAARPVPVHVSPIAMAGAVPQQRQGWRQQEESEEGEDTKKMRAMWFKDMRGWLMVLAMQIASSTYQAGLNPPRGFSGDTSHSTPILESTSHSRYYIFFYSNTTAFVTSLASIILLMNESFYHSEAKVVALETILVLDLVGLMGAYWAGTTTSARRDQTTKYTLVLTAFVLFVVYVVYTVQLLHKLRTLWCLAAAKVAVVSLAAAQRVHAADVAPGGAAPVTSQIDVARSQRLSATPRRRGSRLAGTEPSSMLSP